MMEPLFDATCDATMKSWIRVPIRRWTAGRPTPGGVREVETRDQVGNEELKMNSRKLNKPRNWKLGNFISFIFLFSVFSFSDSASAVSPKNMVLIPQGAFLMGTNPEDGKIGFDIGVDEVPRREVHLPAYYIDKYEVRVGEYEKFLEASSRTPPGDPRFPEIYPWAQGEQPPEHLMDHPVIYVSWYDAWDYCRWTGKRLPGEAEWEKAARGTDGRYWPWGNDVDYSKANVREYGARGTLPVGSFPGGISPYGVHDMSGNVAEWVQDWYQAYPGNDLKRKAFGTVNKVIRGGAWTLFGDPYSRLTHRTRSIDPTKRHRSIGFRCAKDGEK